MGIYREQVLPRVIDKVCGGADMQRFRDRACAGLHGTVVEIGFGSGLNVASYPSEVDLVYAVEPAALGQKLAAPRIARGQARVEHVGLRGEALPLADESCDGALSTFTLCTIPDVAQALAEVVRVLRPGGRFHILEHGIAPDAGVARWQHRLDPIQQVVGGGCHLTRDPLALLRGAGFEIVQSDQRYVAGPKPWTFMTRAVARKPT
ncbi:MAG: class I SAM-dependent methyltransferase [Actinomycetes bacterium]